MTRYLDKLFEGFYVDKNNWDVINKFYRSDGSKNQILVPVDKSDDCKRKVVKTTTFYKLKNKKNGMLAFSKKIKDFEKERREFRILKSVKHKKAIKVIEINDKFGIIFPFYNWSKIEKIKFRSISNKNIFRKEIIDFFQFIKNEIIEIEDSGKLVKRPLESLVDFNVSNFIVKAINNKIIDWLVLDFEDVRDYPRHWNEKHNKRNILRLIGR